MNWVALLGGWALALAMDTVGFSQGEQIIFYLTNVQLVLDMLFTVSYLMLGAGVVFLLLGIVFNDLWAWGFSAAGFILGVVLYAGTLLGMFLTSTMISAVTPELGIVEPIKFYGALFIYLLFGLF